METVIYEGADPIGTLTLAPEGLYWRVNCQLKNTDRIRRIYAISGKQSEYLGIPDVYGRLSVRIPQKHLREVDTAVASTSPRGQWRPWRGELDGVAVDSCYIKEDSEGFAFALTETEAVKFPAWADRMQRERVYGTDVVVLIPDADGHPPRIERENGGTENETVDHKYLDPLLLADLPADHSYGGTDEFNGR